MENNLVKDAAEARKAGMSYGKWMAMKAPVKIVKKKKRGETGVPALRKIAEGSAEEVVQQ